MSLVEIIFLIVIITACLVYLILYISKPFRKKNKDNLCVNCPYADSCKK